MYAYIPEMDTTYSLVIKRPKLCRDNLHKVLEHILRLFSLVENVSAQFSCSFHNVHYQ